MSIAAVHAFFGTNVIASRTDSVTANPTLYSTDRPRAPCLAAVFKLVSQSSRP